MKKLNLNVKILHNNFNENEILFIINRQFMKKLNLSVLLLTRIFIKTNLITHQ